VQASHNGAKDSGFEMKISPESAGARMPAHGKTWAQRSGFAEIPWQTAPSPLNWSKVFAQADGSPGAVG